MNLRFMASSEKHTLIWSPIHAFISEQINQHDNIRLLISPYITYGALQYLLNSSKNVSQLKVITKWNPADIISGVSDIEIYNLLRLKNIPLYINESIHLKLFVFDSSSAFHTSGNITHKGLGLLPDSNKEIGCLVKLSLIDWQHILKILDESFRVDDNIYEKAKNYLLTYKTSVPTVPPLILIPVHDKAFSILSLPASPNPELLYKFYDMRRDDSLTPDELESAFMHDLLLYEIPTGLEEVQFYDLLRANFRRHPFIVTIVSLIKQSRSARFGQVNAWLQSKCSDKPTPYRWETKSSVRILYTWLEFFFEQITWDRPNYSMIIRWNGD